MFNAGKIAKKLNRAIDVMSWIVMICFLLIAGYALWDTWVVYDNSFIDDEMLEYKPADDDPENLSLSDLMKINKDVCAWLTLDDTHVDYPVVHSKDNYQYLNTNVKGEFSLSGALFLSYLNSFDFTDSYNMIYGHHMEKGGMFGDLDYYVEKDFFDKHHHGTLKIPGKTFDLDVYASIKTGETDYLVYSCIGDMSDLQMKDLNKHLKDKGEQYREIDIEPGDQVLALSTCTSYETGGRLLVFAKMIERDGKNEIKKVN